MASPFTIFRKHGRVLMAVLVVMLMVGWGVLGILTDMQQQGSADARDPLVVTSTYGNLSEGKLLQLRQQKNLVRTFLGRVMMLKAQPQFAFFIDRQINQMVGGFSDEALVEDWFLAKEAERRGVVIPDGAVDRFLDDVTGKQVRAEEYRQILVGLQQESPLRPSKATLYNAIRTILASSQMRMMTAGMLYVTPAERFDGYQRLRRRAAVELVPVNAEDFKGKVREPKESELRTLYEKHKNDEPTPGAATPGFKVPAKSSFLYVQANYEKFVRPETITAAEIQAHYDKNKDQQYQFSGLGSDPEPTPPSKPAETPKPMPPATPEKPKTDEKKPDAKPAETPKPMPPATPEKPKTDEKKSSEFRRSAANELLAYADDAAQAAAEVGKTADKASDATTASSTPVTPPAAEVKKPEAPPQLPEKFKLPESVRDGPSPKYDPLWKVEEAIRNQLAREQATKKVEELINLVDNSLVSYSQALFTWDAEVRAAKDESAKQKIVPPKEPDLETIAKQICDKAGYPGGLTAGKTGSISVHEAARLPGLGSSTALDGRPFATQAGRLGMRPFTSLTTTDTAGNRYRILKIAAKDAFVPSFEEAKSDVLNAWKTIEARQLVKHRAEELAAQAVKQNKSLKELFANDKELKVLEPEPFSWLTRNSADPFNQRGAPPQLTEVEGVVDGGDEFMRGVFRLESEGSVGVTFNNPQTTAYVVRIKSYSPSPQLLRDTFLVDPPMESMAALSNDQRQHFQAWLADRRKVAQLEWKREPSADESL